jgi:hypothetical protein
MEILDEFDINIIKKNWKRDVWLIQLSYKLKNIKHQVHQRINRLMEQIITE